jgi:hypothetical protein
MNKNAKNKKSRSKKSSAKIKDLKPKKNPKGGAWPKKIEYSGAKAGSD